MTRKQTKHRGATDEPAEAKGRKPRATTLYPKVSLVDALRLAESIRDNNASRPYNRIDLAASVDLSPESSTLRTLITASSKFGLTEGSYAAERISLTDLGRSIVSPTSDEEKAQGLMTALYKVDFYKNFFERFKNHRLPRKDLLLNTIEREFAISAGDRDQCYELLVKNATELGLLKDVGGTPYVRFDRPTVTAGTAESEPGEDDSATDEPKLPTPPLTTGATTQVDVDLPAPAATDAATTHKPKIFISHSKNMKILTQIKSNLEFGGFSYKVAIETETTAIPIPEKIFGMMRDCNCAIVNVSADEQERREAVPTVPTPTCWSKSALRSLPTTSESFCW